MLRPAPPRSPFDPSLSLSAYLELPVRWVADAWRKRRERPGAGPDPESISGAGRGAFSPGFCCDLAECFIAALRQWRPRHTDAEVEAGFPAVTALRSVFRTTVVPPSTLTVSSKRSVTRVGARARTAPSAGEEETSRACAQAAGAVASDAASAASRQIRRSNVIGGSEQRRERFAVRQW